MTFKEYIESGKKIITDEIRQIYNDILTTDGQDVINDAFLIEYADKIMVTSEETEVNRNVKYILLKNYREYEMLYKTIQQEIDTKYNIIKEIKDDNVTITDKENTISYNESDEKIGNNKDLVTNELGHSKTDNISIEKTGDVTTEHNTEDTTTNTTDNTGTVTTKNTKTPTTTSTKSNKPFDATEFVEVEKVAEGGTDTTDNLQTNALKTTDTGSIKKTGTDKDTYNTTDTHTITSTETDTGTVTTKKDIDETVTKTGTETNTEDGNVTSNTNRTEKEVNLGGLVDDLEKLRLFYSYNFYNRIIEDLLHILSLRNWSLSYWDL